MSTARDEVLARIRQAVSDRPTVNPINRAYRLAGSFSPDGLIDEFTDKVLDYHAAVLSASEELLPGLLASQLTGRRIVVPEGFPHSWLADLDTPPIADEPPLSSAELDAVDGVLTTCAVAIAQTGTVVLDAGPGQGRRALTLIPDNHWVVVRAEQVLAAVPDAIAALDPRRPLTWISGPSSTSDIELARVEGVHGPRHLTVIILN